MRRLSCGVIKWRSRRSRGVVIVVSSCSLMKIYFYGVHCRMNDFFLKLSLEVLGLFRHYGRYYRA